MKVHHYLTYLIFISFLMVFASCNQDAKNEVQNSGIQLSGHSSGYIGRAESIFIHFRDKVQDQINPEDCIHFQPEIKGSFSWDSPQKLIFKPESPMASAKKIEVEISASCLNEENAYSFSLETPPLIAQLTTGQLEFFPSQNLYTLNGQLKTSDWVDVEQLKNHFKAEMNGAPLEVEWNYRPVLHEYHFQIQQIPRGQQTQALHISFKALSDQMETIQLTKDIPSVSEFVLLSVSTENKGGQRVHLVFSNALDKAQDLSGLVQLGNNLPHRRSVNANVLTLYPEQRQAEPVSIEVSAAVRDLKGEVLGQKVIRNADFRALNPQLRWVGQGNILPEKGNRRLPFEAVSLQAVDVEVFRIETDNSKQFISDYDLSSTYPFDRMGKMIYQQKISLDELGSLDQGSWNRYTLDVNKLIQVDPSGLYQVRIGFRPSYSILDCAPEVNERLEDQYVRGGYWNKSSLWSVGYRGFGSSDSYWQDRDSPCKGSYYNTNRFLRKNIYPAHTGLIAKQGEDRSLWVVALDLMTAEEQSDIALFLYDRTGALIKGGKTNQEGWWHAKDLKDKPYLVEARQESGSTFLNIEDGNALSTSQFSTSGLFVPGGLKAYIFAERGIWRPGDTVFAWCILHNELKKLPDTYPIRVQYFDPSGKEVMSKKVISPKGHFYDLSFATPDQAMTGNWRIQVNAGGRNFSKTIPVENIRPNRIVLEGRLRESDYEFQYQGKAKWLHGLDAAGLKVISEARIQNKKRQFEAFPSFQFSDPAKEDWLLEKVVFSGKSNQEGEISFSFDQPDAEQIDGDLEITLRSQIYEPGGSFSSDIYRERMPIYDAFVGVQMPKNEYGFPVVQQNEKGSFPVLCLDEGGQPLQNQKVTIGFYKVDRYYWWDSDRFNYSRYNSRQHEEAIEVLELRTDAKGKAEVFFVPQDYGPYLVRVVHSEGHTAGGLFYSSYWGNASDDDEGIAALPMKIQRQEVTVGEEMELIIPGIKKSKVLVSLESGTEVLSTFWVEGLEGKQMIRIPVTPEMSPGVYINVTQIQSIEDRNNSLPVRRYALEYVDVRDPETELQIDLDMPDRLAPNQSFTVKVKEKNGQPMDYSLMIVDEGLLSLTRFNSPNPHQHFFAREQLGVQTYDFYDKLLLEYSSDYDRLLAIGGDGYESTLVPEVNRFRPVVLTEGPIHLDRGEVKEHRFTMPNYFGKVRCMLVAAGDGKFGATDQSVEVKNDLMLTATLPRQLGVREEIQIPFTVFVNEKLPSGKVDLSLTLKGAAQIQGSGKSSVQSPSPGIYQTYMGIKTLDQEDTLEVIAEARSGQKKSSYRFFIPIKNAQPVLQNYSVGYLKANGQLSFEPLKLDGILSQTLEISGAYPLLPEQSLKRLIDYPYGCLEQTVSSAFPQLFVSQWTPLNEREKKALEYNIQKAIEKLVSFQQSSGSFTYWPNSYYSGWADVYAGHFLWEAKNQGYLLPNGMFKRWIQAASRQSQRWVPAADQRNPYSMNTEIQAYRLFVLALAGNADVSSMNRLREAPIKNKMVQMLLAQSYALIGQKEVAQDMMSARSSWNASSQEYHPTTFGSRIRDEAVSLYALSVAGNMDEASESAAILLEDVEAGTRFNTQTTSFLLMAFATFNQQKGDQAGMQLNVRSQSFNREITSEHSSQMESLPTQEKGRLDIQNMVDQNFLVGRMIDYQPKEITVTDVANRMKLDIRYTDSNGKPLNTQLLKQGELFTMTVRVQALDANSLDGQLALHIPIPNGWEIINDRLTSGAEAYPGFDYVDIKDDAIDAFCTDLPANKGLSIALKLSSSYAGTYHQYPVTCEHMYQSNYYAAKGGRTIEVRPSD